jgi:hypothetical protein
MTIRPRDLLLNWIAIIGTIRQSGGLWALRQAQRDFGGIFGEKMGLGRFRLVPSRPAANHMRPTANYKYYA